MSITLTTNVEEVVSSLQSKAEALPSAVAAKLNILALALQRHIIEEKLQGQVLKPGTGPGPHLADSIRVTPMQSGNTIGISVSVEGPAAAHGMIQEYGSSSSYLIAPAATRALKFLSGAKEVFAKKVIHPPIQERSFLRSSLLDMEPEIQAGIEEAAKTGMEDA